MLISGKMSWSNLNEGRMGKKIKLTSEDFYSWGFAVQNKWLEIKNCDRSLISYFRDNHMKKAAVYGAGALGRRLIEELLSEGLEVACVIDKNHSNIKNLPGAVSIVGFDRDWPDCDVIIITPIQFYKIEKDIRKKTGYDIEIAAIDDVVDYCYEKIKK